MLTGCGGAPATGLGPADAEALIEAAERLYEVLERGSLLGRRCRRRVDILTTVCQLLDRSQPKLQLALGRIIFAVSASSQFSLFLHLLLERGFLTVLPLRYQLSRQIIS